MISTFRNYVSTLLLCLTLLLTSGCGDTGDDSMTDANTPNRVSGSALHRSWGSYRLYQYEAGIWHPVINLGQTVAPLPVIGNRPAIIVHGLGSDIASNRFVDLAKGFSASGATSIFGFEYDSLDPISTNGAHFTEALNFLTQNEQTNRWNIAAHSMGTLVVRSSLESGATFKMTPVGNRTSFVAGPHLGSEVTSVLQAVSPSVAQEALNVLSSSGQLVFFNADGSRVEVSGAEPGIRDLTEGSAFLQILNLGAANRHPQFDYRTLAGTKRGTQLEIFNRLLGIFADDGLVNISSANAQVIGATSNDGLPFDHSEIVEAPEAILRILSQLGF